MLMQSGERRIWPVKLFLLLNQTRDKYVFHNLAKFRGASKLSGSIISKIQMDGLF